MSLGEVIRLFNEAIVEILLLCSPVLIIGTVVGLVISILQATTQIQDQTISFVPKIVTILMTFLIFGPWMFTSLRNYTISLFQMIPQMVK